MKPLSEIDWVYVGLSAVMALFWLWVGILTAADCLALTGHDGAGMRVLDGLLAFAIVPLSLWSSARDVRKAIA